jgi:hypothetical protein
VCVCLCVCVCVCVCVAAFNFNLFSAVAGAAEFKPEGGGADSKMKLETVYNAPVPMVFEMQQATASTGGGNLARDVDSAGEI